MHSPWVWVILTGLFSVWAVYRIRTLRKNKELFTKENFSKTMSTWGFLTLMLIAVVALCVWSLKP
jgi:hypothetical protein